MMGTSSPAALSLVRLGRSLAKAYAAVFFSHSPRIGIWFAVLTWWTPRAALGGLTPQSLLDTADGREAVSTLLYQMKSGAYA